MKEGKVLRNFVGYEGPGVYALIDDEGKKYIGSSINVKKRVFAHEANFRRVLKRGNSPYCGNKLADAVLHGKRFSSVLIEPLERGGSFHDLLAMERKALESEGGCDNTYNAMEVKDYRGSDTELIKLWEKEGTEKAKRIVRELRLRYYDRELPMKPEYWDKVTI